MISTMLSVNKTAASEPVLADILTLKINFHTQTTEFDRIHSVLKYKIAEATFDTDDVLKALAEDLQITDNGHPGFPKGSLLMLSGGGSKIYVKSNTGQAWDVSAYLQYSLASEAVLIRGTTPIYYYATAYIGAGNSPTPFGATYASLNQAGIIYTSLVHIHFEDSRYLADFTGFANTHGGFLPSAAFTEISCASGSGMLHGKPALITADAKLTQIPTLSPVVPFWSNTTSPSETTANP